MLLASRQLVQRTFNQFHKKLVFSTQVAAKHCGLAREYFFESAIERNYPEYDHFFTHTRILSRVGGTPIIKIADNVFLKTEGENPTGSIKDRVALYVLLDKLRNAIVEDGTRLVLATSGSYGLSMYFIKAVVEAYFNISIGLTVVTPGSYSIKPAIMTLALKPDVLVKKESDDDIFDPDVSRGNELIYVDENFDAAIRLAKKIGDTENGVFIDQQHDELHLLSHQTTAEEIYYQLPELTDVVLATGTGATATGLVRFLPSSVRIHTRPAHSGEIDGLTDPRKYKNYFDENRFFGYGTSFFTKTVASYYQRQLIGNGKLNVGLSTGAALSLVKDIKSENSDAVISVISASRY